MKFQNYAAWTIGRKLAAGFAAVIFLSIILGVAGLYAINRVKTTVDRTIAIDARSEALARMIEISMLEARRREKDFFLRYKALGVEEAKAEYVPQVRAQVEAIHRHIDEGVALTQSQGRGEEVALYRQLGQLVDSYETDFLQAVSLIEQRGHADTGLEGEARNKIREIEAVVTERKLDQLMIDTLMIQQYEKEYLLRGNQEYIDRVAQGITQFKENVTKAPAGQLSVADKNQLNSLADEFLILFQLLVQSDAGIRATTERFQETLHTIDLATDELRTAGNEQFNMSVTDVGQTVSAANVLEVVVLIIVVLLGAGITFLLSRSIVRPIRELTDMSATMAGGDLSQRVHISSRDELGALADSFNRMADKLGQVIETEQQAQQTLQNTVIEYVAFADRVKVGDLNGQLFLNGDEDSPLVMLGHNINNMVDNLRQQVEAEQEARTHQEKTVDNYLAFIRRVAEGDLTARLSLNGSDDPLTSLGHNLNGMVERLGKMTDQIQQATANISAAASEILAATSQQASGANEQSAAITQTSTTIDEVKTVVEQAFAKARAVAELAQRTQDISQGGRQAVTDTVLSMSQIKEKVEGIAENILALSEQTQQIGEITSTVNELAAQSNLLALNASVEAARAGEHGKGFAVVALEVRNLAEQSRQATTQIKAILNEIQRATNAAVMATEEGTKGVDAGVQLTRQAGETIQQLAGSIVESSSAAQQIVASAQQQTTGVEQIALAIQNINQATVQNLASTRQTEKSAQDLALVAHQLEQLVDRYKLS
jgi:methyl-accepting chemotaxis protein